jgi:hypothetical protein
MTDTKLKFTSSQTAVASIEQNKAARCSTSNAGGCEQLHTFEAIIAVFPDAQQACCYAHTPKLPNVTCCTQ